MIILGDNAVGHITITRMEPIWKKMGHRITTNINDKCNVQLSFVRIGMKTKLPKCLRLDGIYYDSATNYNARNQDISISHSMADAVIYQSKYSQMLIESLLKSRKVGAKYNVIYNGINDNWSGKFKPHNNINITISGKHRRHKRLKEIIELFLIFNKTYKDSILHIFGRMHDNVEVKHPKIKYYGHVDRNKMFEVLNVTDMTIHLSKRDSCPNSVVEYIGAGIPVITTNNVGGGTEMCQMTPGCIIVDGDGSYDDISPVPHYGEAWNVLPGGVSKGILEAMNSIANDKRRVIVPEKLKIEHQAEEYIKLMKGII